MFGCVVGLSVVLDLEGSLVKVHLDVSLTDLDLGK